MMCSSNVGTEKSPDLSDFHPCPGVASLSQSLQVSRLALSSARATFKRNNLSHARENASLVNKEPEWSDERLSSKKKKEEKKRAEKSASPSSSGVIFEAGSVRIWVGYVSPNKHTIYRTDTGIKLLFILVFFFFLLFSGLISKKKKKKPAAQVLSSRRGEQEGLA